MKNIIPAVDRALYMAELLNRSANGLSQTELVERSGVSTTTGYRILQTFLAHGWAERTSEGLYRLTGSIPSVSNPAAVLVEKGQPVLDELAQKTRLSCKLSIRQGKEQLSVLRADSPEPFGISGKNGVRFPVIEGSVGAVLLSGETKKVILALAASEKEEIPEKQDPSIILSRIQRLKENGWVLNMSPCRWRVQAMSVPVMVHNKVLAAVTLLGLKEDFTEPEKLVVPLLEASGKLTQRCLL